MGELLHHLSAKKKVRTLNGLFNATNFEATRQRVFVLRTIFPTLLKGPGSMNESGRRKRLRSLRFAASILADNIKYSPKGAHDPSAGNLRTFLKWLLWIQLNPPNDYVVQENGRDLKDVTPHDLISRTIAKAIDDEDAGEIQFDWVERASPFKVDVNWDYNGLDANPNEPPENDVRHYKITVYSVRANDKSVVVDEAAGDEVDPDS